MKSGGNKWDVSIELESTVEEFKQAIEQESGVPSGQQRLIYSGKILKDAETLASYHVQDDHAVHMVRSGGGSTGGNTSNANNATNATNTGAASGSNIALNNAASTTPSLATGQTSGFNPLADLTGARYAGYANLPSADMFGPDGGMTSSGPNQDDILRMMDNPIFQSQMNEMLSNPEMVDFMIQSNPQLQAMGPQARQMLQSPFFRQMLTNPDMIRQSMQFSHLMGGSGNANTASDEAFPAPGEDAPPQTTTSTNQAPPASNPFAALFPGGIPNLAAFNGQTNGTPLSAGAGGAGGVNPGLQSMLQSFAPPQDNRPPEERYESQLRQLNDMGFFDFDRNVAALRRAGGSVQGALDALLNGDV